jgi:ABC-type cobalt transport system substrate-binding protein
MDAETYNKRMSKFPKHIRDAVERQIPAMYIIWMELKPFAGKDDNINDIVTTIETAFDFLAGRAWRPRKNDVESLSGLSASALAALPFGIVGVGILCVAAATAYKTSPTLKKQVDKGWAEFTRKLAKAKQRVVDKIKNPQTPPGKKKPKPQPWLGDALKAISISAAVTTIALSEGGQSIITDTGKAVKKTPGAMTDIAKYVAAGVLVFFITTMIWGK